MGCGNGSAPSPATHRLFTPSAAPRGGSGRERVGTGKVLTCSDFFIAVLLDQRRGQGERGEGREGRLLCCPTPR